MLLLDQSTVKPGFFFSDDAKGEILLVDGICCKGTSKQTVLSCLVTNQNAWFELESPRLGHSNHV